MTQLSKIATVEAKLLFRERGTWLFAVLLPTLILLVLGSIPGLRTPNDAFGGQRFIDVFVPSLVVMTLAILGVNTLPLRLATYREQGVLRRLSTTPANPALVLIAQLVINMGMAVAAITLLVTVGRLAFQIPLPQHPVGFLAAVVLGMAALFSLGLLIAAVVPTARAATALVTPVFILVMFSGGVYVPRIFLPDMLIRLGAYVPPGVQTLLDTWTGGAPQPLPLATMATITVVAGVAAARVFRWE